MKIFLNFLMIIYRFIVTGTLSNNGYIMKYNPSMFDSLTNFTPSTWTMNVLASGTDDITSTTSLSLTSLSRTVSNPSYTNETLTYNQVSASSYDVFINTNAQSYTLVEKYSSTETPNLTCSSSGLTAIYFNIANLNGSLAPDWIKIDPFSGALNISALDVNSDNSTSIYINSIIADPSYPNPIKKQINIKINN